MILSIYFLMMILSVIMIFFGYYFDEPMLKVVGYGFIFILNVSIINDGIQYHSGDIVDDTLSPIIVTMTYDTYNSHLIGFFFAIIGFIGATIEAWMGYKVRFGRNDD